MKLDKKLTNKKSKAQSLIEYALILAMVTVIAVTALQLLGQNMSNTLKNLLRLLILAQMMFKEKLACHLAEIGLRVQKILREAAVSAMRAEAS